MPVLLDPQPITAVRADLLRKLLTRALHPSTTDAEAENAGVRFTHAARRFGLGLDELAELLGKSIDPPAASYVVIGQGKYAGCTLLEIAEEDLPYMRWMAREFRDPELRAAAGVVLAFITGGQSDA